MGKFVFGMIVGLIVGAAGMVLVYEKPWDRPAAQPAQPVEADAGPAKPGKKRRRGRKRRRGSEASPGDDIVELSAADRSSVWRGQAVALPPKDIDFEGASGRPLNQDEIDAGLRGGVNAVADCIGEARGNAEIAADITLKMLVDPSGRVTAKRIRAPKYLQDNGLLRCVTGAISRMRFPGTGAHTVVSVPFSLD